MDDRYQCTAVPGTGILSLPTSPPPAFLTSGTLVLTAGETVTRKLTFSDQAEEGTWHVDVPSGLQPVGRDSQMPILQFIPMNGTWNSKTRIPGSRGWSLSLSRKFTGLGTIVSGNATVLVHYFGGPARFPAPVSVTFTCAMPESPVSSLPQAILEYPIIVIYSASWATLIALVVVIIWAHKRRNKP